MYEEIGSGNDAPPGKRRVGCLECQWNYVIVPGRKAGSEYGKIRQVSKSISEGNCQVWHECPLSLSTVLVVTELLLFF